MTARAVFVNPSYLRVWASWCAVHELRAELQAALLDAAVEIERLQRLVGERMVNGNVRANANNEVQHESSSIRGDSGSGDGIDGSGGCHVPA